MSSTIPTPKLTRCVLLLQWLHHPFIIERTCLERQLKNSLMELKTQSTAVSIISISISIVTENMIQFIEQALQIHSEDLKHRINRRKCHTQRHLQGEC